MDSNIISGIIADTATMVATLIPLMISTKKIYK